MLQWSGSSKFSSGPTSWCCSQDSLPQCRDFISKGGPLVGVSERPTVGMLITLGGPVCHFSVCYWHCHCVGSARGSVYHFISGFPTESWRLQLPLHCCSHPIPVMWAETQKNLFSATLEERPCIHTQSTLQQQQSQCFTPSYSTTFLLATLGCFSEHASSKSVRFLL